MDVREVVKEALKTYLEWKGNIVFEKDNRLFVVSDPIDSPILSAIYQAAETMPAPTWHPLPDRGDGVDINIEELRMRVLFAIEVYICADIDLEVIVDYGDEDCCSPYRYFIEDIVRKACDCNFQRMLKEMTNVYEWYEEVLERINALLNSTIIFPEKYDEKTTTFRVVWRKGWSDDFLTLKIKVNHPFLAYVYKEEGDRVLIEPLIDPHTTSKKVYSWSSENVKSFIRELIERKQEYQKKKEKTKKAIEKIEALAQQCKRLRSRVA